MRTDGASNKEGEAVHSSPYHLNGNAEVRIKAKLEMYDKTMAMPYESTATSYTEGPLEPWSDVRYKVTQAEGLARERERETGEGRGS